MDPITISALVGGASSLFGGLLGADAQSEAADKNYQINLLNYYARERERQDRIDMANTVRDEEHLGSTDAHGNRVHFVPGQGWVTDLSGDQQGLMDLQDTEQRQTLTHDLPARRQQMDRNIKRQKDEDYIAEGFRRQLGDVGESSRDTTARYRTAAVQGVNENWDNLINAASRDAMRTGATNTGAVMRDLAKGRMDATSDAMMKAEMVGDQVHDQSSAARESRLANLYNTFATRASASPTVSYKADNIDSGANAQMDSFARLATGGDSAAVSAYGNKGGTLDYEQPNYGLANTVTNTGQSIANSLDGSAARKAYEKRYAGSSSQNERF